ncbi:MAG: hypothetical protein ABEI78_01860, partial [Candidatus Nanohaloarchaea archaeon]
MKDCDLSDDVSEFLDQVSKEVDIAFSEDEKRRYCLSEGMGMELWEFFHVLGYSPDELERIKNELRSNDLMVVEKVECSQPYFS